MRTFIALLILLPLYSRTGEPKPLPDTTPWDIPALKKPPAFDWVEKDKPVKSLQYASISYRGKATSVFAYYASPKDFGSKEKTFPAMVLVHGGGGRAFDRWVEIWAKRGYAAIAMDLSGRGPRGQKRLPDGGPEQSYQAKFEAIDQPVENQWSYHAVANVVLAHSLLRNLPGVDSQRIGLTGISWGGYTTCIVAGIDDRFAFAMPIYGCGFLRDNSAWTNSEFAKMSSAQVDKWTTLWDPSRYIGSARMPLVFINGTHDFAYPLDSYAKTCNLVQTETHYSIQLKMRHGHIFDFPEFFAYADYFLKGENAPPTLDQLHTDDRSVSALVKTTTPIARARLHYTIEPHQRNKERYWETRVLEHNGQSVRGEAPPEEAIAWFIDVRDTNGLLISSPVRIP